MFTHRHTLTHKEREREREIFGMGKWYFYCDKVAFDSITQGPGFRDDDPLIWVTDYSPVRILAPRIDITLYTVERVCLRTPARSENPDPSQITANCAALPLLLQGYETETCSKQDACVHMCVHVYA